MNDVVMLDREAAERYAEWFRTLSDATRVQLLAYLAQQVQPLAVRDIVAAFPVAQSTVSHHLAALAAAGFLLVTRAGTSNRYALDAACLREFPDVAALVVRGGACCLEDLPPHLRTPSAEGAVS
ncbi:ArsR/SmtB family transcription factor [Serinicoccus kebangsaanensis]|uniref:ArsR/SmtB family transcription factor n=1 Tax=Serinicoccus kebangsaanensis TaxID=2602069 RepID=UPI00124C2749|nr:metalloregulator ArsR/SmtB family transcription factor [Serinicoccus kebangsaanensis]